MRRTRPVRISERSGPGDVFPNSAEMAHIVPPCLAARITVSKGLRREGERDQIKMQVERTVKDVKNTVKDTTEDVRNAVKDTAEIIKESTNK